MDEKNAPNSLACYKHLAADSHVVESWELSAMQDSRSTVCQGIHSGKTIADLVELFGEDLLGHAVVEKYGKGFPLAVKIILSTGYSPLSVHPADSDDGECHTRGRDDFWYVLDAPKGAEAYVGLNASVSAEEFVDKVLDGSILDIMSHTTLASGDIFHIPAGRVHGISQGVLLMEIFDPTVDVCEIYDFKEGRSISRDEAIRASEMVELAVLPSYRTEPETPVDGVEGLSHTRHFSVERISISGPKTFFNYMADTFHFYHCISGEVTLWTDSESSVITLRGGESALVPAVARRIRFDGEGTLISAFM